MSLFIGLLHQFELGEYALKHEWVSAVCRLTFEEEVELLDFVAHSSAQLSSDGSSAGERSDKGGGLATRWWSDIDNVDLYNRYNLLKAALAPPSPSLAASGPRVPIRVAYRKGPAAAAAKGNQGQEAGGLAGGQGTGVSPLPMFDAVHDR